MSGINVLRRDNNGVCERADVSLDKREARKRAFEANLALKLEKALGGDASIREIASITQALSKAYERMTHAIDACTSLGACLNRYFVMQAGWTQKTGDHRIDALDPFAARLLGYLPASAMDAIEPRIKAVGGALAKTEISRKHPLDWRLRLNTPWVRFYLTFLSGQDKRDHTNRVTHDRRKPVNESLELLVLMVVAAALSLLGAGLIISTRRALSDLLLSQMGRDTLAALFGNSMSNLSTFITGLGWFRLI